MTYEEMIEDETFIDGMQTRIISDQEMDTMYIPDVEYMNSDEIRRVLQILVPRMKNIHLLFTFKVLPGINKMFINM